MIEWDQMQHEIRGATKVAILAHPVLHLLDYCKKQITLQTFLPVFLVLREITFKWS